MPVVLQPLCKKRHSVRELTSLLHRAYRPLAHKGLHYVASHQSVRATRRRLRRGHAWVAVDDDRLVGTILLCPPRLVRDHPVYDQRETATFHQFAVDPDYQGLGIGAELLHLTEERAARLGARLLALDTAADAVELIRYYERRGYRRMSRANWKTTNYESVILAKRIARHHCSSHR